MITIFSILFIFFEGFWRDCFGKDGWNIPILKYRATQHILGLLVISSFGYFVKELSMVWSIYLACVVQFIVWAKGHGPYYDIGTDTLLNKKTKERYEKVLGKRITNWLCTVEMKYGMVYDAIGMAARYSLLFILLFPILNFVSLFTGIIISFVYWVYRYSPNDSIFHTKRWLDVEIISGLVIGSIIAFC